MYTQLLLPRQAPHEGEAQSFPRGDVDFRVVVVPARHRERVALRVHGARRVARAAVRDRFVETCLLHSVVIILYLIKYINSIFIIGTIIEKKYLRQCLLYVFFLIDVEVDCNVMACDGCKLKF